MRTVHANGRLGVTSIAPPSPAPRAGAGAQHEQPADNHAQAMAHTLHRLQQQQAAHMGRVRFQDAPPPGARARPPTPPPPAAADWEGELSLGLQEAPGSSMARQQSMPAAPPSLDLSVPLRYQQRAPSSDDLHRLFQQWSEDVGSLPSPVGGDVPWDPLGEADVALEEWLARPPPATSSLNRAASAPAPNPANANHWAEPPAFF